MPLKEICQYCFTKNYGKAYYFLNKLFSKPRKDDTIKIQLNFGVIKWKKGQ